MAERNFDRRAFLKAIPVVGGAIYAANEAGLFIPRTAEAAPAGEQLEGGQITFEGFAPKAENVLTTDVSLEKFGNKYSNETGLGTNAFLAEPGVLLFGQEDVAKAKQIGAATNTNYNEWLVNPNTQQIFENTTASLRVKEGGFARVSLGGGTLSIDGMRLTLGFDQVTHFNVFVRGFGKDGGTPEDRNRPLDLSGLAAGNVMGEQLPRGAYVSEGYYKQLLADAFAGGGNQNGAEGSRKIYTIYMDRNTKALNIIRYDAPNAAPVSVYKNY